MNALQRLITFLLLVLGSGSSLLAQLNSPASRAQIEAATNNAMATLRSDIAAARMTPTYTVGQYLDAVGAPEVLNDIVRDARQIGGPRWIDDQTCQVKLEVPGSKIAYDIIAVAYTREKMRIAPIPAAALEQQMADFKQRIFTATGTSVSAERLAGIRPVEAGDRWNAVTDAQRKQAVDAARQDAVRRALDSVRNVPVGSNQTVNDLLSREDVRQNVDKWLSSRPVTELKFKEDLQIELTVSTPPDELLQAVIDSARQTPGTTLPTDEPSLDQLRREFSKRVSSIGRASVTNGVGQTAQPGLQVQKIHLPELPPTWAQQAIDAEGMSPTGKDRFRARNQAQEQASLNLRAKIGALPLSRTMTIDQAVKQDPRIAQAVNRAMLRARVTRSDYKQPDGSVLIGMTLDSWVLWTELQQATGQ
jgi:hypothetical protein